MEELKKQMLDLIDKKGKITVAEARKVVDDLEECFKLLRELEEYGVMRVYLPRFRVGDYPVSKKPTEISISYIMYYTRGCLEDEDFTFQFVDGRSGRTVKVSLDNPTKS